MELTFQVAIRIDFWRSGGANNAVFTVFIRQRRDMHGLTFIW
jgi:hypothetical protein